MNKTGSSLLLQRQQIWVYVVGVLFLADFVFYGYLPSHRRLQSLEQARIQQERLIQTTESQERALPALEQSLKTLGKAVLRYDDTVPAERALGPFLGQIANIMTEHSLTDQVVEPGGETQAGELNCIPVRMNCKGSLNGIFGFFNDLQGLGRLVRIEKVTLKNDGDYTGQVTMQTEAMIFYRPQRQQGTGDFAGVISRGTAQNDT
jgi:Tfp pilus assembly protein PilO